MPDDPKTILDEGACCDGVPHSKQDRDNLRRSARAYVIDNALIPPVPFEEMKQHAVIILQDADLAEEYLPFLLVVLSNELWRDSLVRIPFKKRLLLLPQCLKHSEKCTAEIDHLGLLCKHCGKCTIDRFTRRAEELGYAVLVAEGSPVVMAMIESGQIHATVGVSCLSVLERVFPYMEQAAVPGMAIPLLKDGCKDTLFDTDWLVDILETFEGTESTSFDVTGLKRVVQDWFEPERIGVYFAADGGQAEQLALQWLSQQGKRYRPMLAAGIYATLTETGIDAIPAAVKQAAIAVECFHKASLIHDDIEDGDDKRYDKDTLHVQYGIPIALNVGDYLIGIGYELLSGLDCPDEQKVRVLQIASEGHRILCQGQGAELESVSACQKLSVEQVIDIFAQKTSPAFGVALKTGAVMADADKELLETLADYSKAIGIAYQIRDDRQDWQTGQAHKQLSIMASMDKASATEQAGELLEKYRKQTIETLSGVEQADCKAFLRKVITKIFDGSERMGCCDEHTPESD